MADIDLSDKDKEDLIRVIIDLKRHISRMEDTISVLCTTVQELVRVNT